MYVNVVCGVTGWRSGACSRQVGARGMFASVPRVVWCAVCVARNQDRQKACRARWAGNVGRAAP